MDSLRLSAFCKKLCAQDAGPLQDLRVQDFIQPPYVEESTGLTQQLFQNVHTVGEEEAIWSGSLLSALF